MSGGPRRTCVGCRQVRAKGELLRLVRGSDGCVAVDRRHRASGRGAYTCPTTECLEKTLAHGRLARALRGAVRPPRESAAEILEFWRRR